MGPRCSRDVPAESARPIDNVQYDDVGHILPLPGETPRTRSWSPAINHGLLYGGSEAAGRAVADDYWARVLRFLRGIGG